MQVEQDEDRWDLETIYDEQIAHLMTQIISICKEHNMPMLASFAFRADEDGADFCTTYLAFDGRTPPRYVAAAAAVLGGR